MRPEIIDNIRKLNEIAERRGQTLAQMAIAWVLRGGRVTSALIGASRSAQIVDCVKALDKPDFTAEELAAIDTYSKGADVNRWKKSAELE
jgi:L-glyceraldehyde 3-phosphate reductase